MLHTDYLSRYKNWIKCTIQGSRTHYLELGVKGHALSMQDARWELDLLGI